MRFKNVSSLIFIFLLKPRDLTKKRWLNIVCHFLRIILKYFKSFVIILLIPEYIATLLKLAQMVTKFDLHVYLTV